MRVIFTVIIARREIRRRSAPTSSEAPAQKGAVTNPILQSSGLDPARELTG